MISLFLPLAHGLLIGRQDLPIPTWLFAWGASVVLIVSFVALSVAWRDSKLSSDRWRPVPERLSRPLTGRVTEIVTGAIGVFLLGAVVYTGLEGTDEPSLNFAVTFVFVTFWLGMVVLSILLGDLFRAFNPWRAIARTVGAVFRLIAGQPHSPPLRYPEWLGRWPAAAGIVAFVWLELVYATSGLGAVGLQPSDGRGRDARLHRLHADRDGAVRGRDLASARRGLLGLLRDVLAARSARGPRRAAGDPPPAGRGHALGPASPVRSRWSSRRSARRPSMAPRKGCGRSRSATSSTVSPTSGSGRPPPSGPRSRSSSHSPWRESRRSTGPACAGCAPCAAPPP